MTAGEVLLTASRLDKAFGERRLCAGVSFGLAAGQRVGLIGDNGAGKSTLLAMLAGIEPPDAGQVVMRGGLTTAFVPQVARFSASRVGEVWASAHAGLRALQAACEQAAARGSDTRALLADIERLGGWDLEHRVARVAAEVGLADIDPARPVESLSGGQAKRLALGRMALSSPDVVFLDEPTNHLDLEAIGWLEAWLTRCPRAAVIVTHDRAFLEAVVDTMAELRGGRLRLYQGSYAEYVVARATLEAQAARASARRLRILRAEAAWAFRSPKARGTRPEARLRRLAALTAQMPKEAAPTFEVALPGPGGGPPPGRVLAELSGVQAEARRGAPLFMPLTLALKAKERWGVVGGNGVGKTTLLRVLQGTQAPSAGRIRLAPRVAVATFDQHRADLDPQRRVAEALSPSGAPQVVVEGRAVHVAGYLRRFGFAESALGRSVAHLSGGEASRLALAKFLLTDAAVLLFDEPTNDLDLLTLSILEDALMNFAGALVVVSHDRYFLDKVVTNTVLFVGAEGAASGAPRRLIVEPGPPERAMAVASAEKRSAPAPATRPKPASMGRARPPEPPGEDMGRRGPLSFTERHRLRELEREIATTERGVAEAQQALSDPSMWAEKEAPARGRALGASLAEAEGRLDRLMTAWEALAERDTS